MKIETFTPISQAGIAFAYDTNNPNFALKVTDALETAFKAVQETLAKDGDWVRISIEIARKVPQ